MKKSIYFYGPVDLTYGPGIKNTYTIKYLEKEYQITKFNTRNISFFNKIKFLLSYIFSLKSTIIAVSSRGRSYMLPIAYLKSKLFPKYKYGIISINGYIESEFTGRGIKKRLIFNALKNSQVIFVEIQGLESRLKTLYGLKQVKYFPNFKPDQEFISYEQTANSKVNTKKLKAVFLARVTFTKGVDIAINTIRELIAEGYAIELDIYGPIADDAKIMIETLSRDENINYCGNIPNSLVTKTLSNYNLFLFPTKHPREGFPASIVDAYSAALPIIGTNICFNQEIISDCNCGFVFPLGDYKTFKEQIITLYTDRELLFNMARTSYDNGQKYYATKVFNTMISQIKDTTL